MIGNFSFDFSLVLDGVAGIVRLLTLLLTSAANNMFSLLSISVLLASLLCMREFQQTNELIILYSAHYPFTKILRLLAVATMFAGGVDLIAVKGLSYAVNVLQPTVYSGSVWRTSQHQVLHATLHQQTPSTLYNPVLLRFDPQQKRLVMVMYGKSMAQQNTRWLWQNVYIRRYTPQKTWKLEHYPQKTMLIENIPNPLSLHKERLMQKGWLQAWEAYREGNMTSRVLSAWTFTVHQQLSHIASFLLLMYLGASAIHPLPRVGKTVWALVWVFLLGGTYLFAKQAITFLGEASVLHPVVASWSTEGVLLAILLIMRLVKTA